jgi:hypothetical protein
VHCTSSKDLIIYIALFKIIERKKIHITFSFCKKKSKVYLEMIRIIFSVIVPCKKKKKSEAVIYIIIVHYRTISNYLIIRWSLYQLSYLAPNYQKSDRLSGNTKFEVRGKVYVLLSITKMYKLANWSRSRPSNITSCSRVPDHAAEEEAKQLNIQMRRESST